jgi:hypothetical protein
MNWTRAVIQAIVITGISALISYLISSRQKQLDFTYDYRKFILNKRKEAYSEIEKLLPTIRAKNIAILTTMRFTWESFVEVNDIIRDTSEVHGFWISKEMNGILDDITRLFVTARVNSSGSVGWKDENFTKFVNDTYRKMAEIEECYFKDIIRLDDIDAFKKEKMAYHRKQIADASDPVL